MHSRKPGTTRGFGGLDDFEFHAPVSKTRGFPSGSKLIVVFIVSNKFLKNFLNPRGGVKIGSTMHVIISCISIDVISFGCQ